jgi:shikimate kinase
MTNPHAIVLVGPMGVGKTTIGKKLAKSLERKFVDSDQLIVKEHGEIATIFEQSGEKHFRELESETVISLLNDPIVLATGGGAVLSERTRSALGLATVIYLATDGKHIGSRIRSGKRPLIKRGMSDWRAIYDARRHLYEEVADITIDTSAKSLHETLETISEELSKIA